MKPIVLLISLLLTAPALLAVDWPATSIRASVSRDDTFLKVGQFLQVDRTLKNDEAGWTQFRLDIPDAWKVAKVEVEKEGVSLMLTDKRVFLVTSSEIGDLSFRLLDGGDKKDREVVKIWAAYEKKN